MSVATSDLPEAMAVPEAASATSPASSTSDVAAAPASGAAGPLGLLDEAEFAAIGVHLKEEDEKRDFLIKRSRDVLKLSKMSVYALHRREFDKARKQLEEAKEIAVRELIPVAAIHAHLRGGSLSGALEEWAEAYIFLGFLEQGRIPTMRELEITTVEEYLGGVMDFTGEVGRHAVLAATRRDLAAVQLARDVVDQLHAQLMQYDFRNGNLRRKFDAVKYTVKKLEQILYELTLSSMTAGLSFVSPKEEEPRTEDAASYEDGDGAAGGGGGADGGGEGESGGGEFGAGRGRGGARGGGRGGGGAKRPRP